MSLLEEARELQRRSGGVCTVARLLQALDESEARELTEAIGHVQDKALARACQERGWDINAFVIGRHRRGDCKCHS